MEFFNDNGTDPLKPSLFELLAQEQLRDLLQPALKYVLAVRNGDLFHSTSYLPAIGFCATLSSLHPAHSQSS